MRFLLPRHGFSVDSARSRFALVMTAFPGWMGLGGCRGFPVISLWCRRGLSVEHPSGYVASASSILYGSGFSCGGLERYSLAKRTQKLKVVRSSSGMALRCAGNALPVMGEGLPSSGFYAVRIRL